ncbi:MAG TPA: TetR/AcrR family transcriptional regulator [Streptosporangiaceae bacterium]|jgi:AcrR family transcriptional regulator
MAERSADDRSRQIREWLTNWAAAQHEQDGQSRTPDNQSIWEYLSRPPRGPRPALTHNQIATAAVQLADEAGLDAVTMRALAKRLDVATMGLYRYVRGKDDIYALMLNTAVGEISLPDKHDDDWRAAFRRLAGEMRGMYLRHTWLPQLEAGTFGMIAPNSLAVIEAGLAALDNVGRDLDVDEMMAAAGAIAAYVRGSATSAIARQEAYRRFGWSSDDDMRAASGPPLLRVLARGDYPTLARYIVDGSNEDDDEWQFSFGLECVLGGVAARLGI